MGLSYIAAYLRQKEINVNLVDCTFLSQEEALHRVRNSKPTIIGIYSMFSMKDQAIKMATLLRHDCEMLVAGGPCPQSVPKTF